MVYVFLANGFEEIEALTAVDILRRAEIDVKTVGIGSNIIRGSHDIPVITDLDSNEIELNEQLEMIVLPGGMPGTLNLEENSNLQKAIEFCLVRSFCSKKKRLDFPGLKKSLDKQYIQVI